MKKKATTYEERKKIYEIKKIRRAEAEAKAILKEEEKRIIKELREKGTVEDESSRVTIIKRKLPKTVDKEGKPIDPSNIPKARPAIRRVDKEGRPILSYLQAHRQAIHNAIREEKKRTEVRRIKENPPMVLNEWETIRLVLKGYSISRYGDGEVKHMDGVKNVSQEVDGDLRVALNRVFKSNTPRHIVAIPNVYSDLAFINATEDYIYSMMIRFAKIADMDKVYGSSYITRADLCPYFANPGYWSLISELWRDKGVVLVRGVAKRANPHGMMSQAMDLIELEIPAKNAWCCYKEIFSECMSMPEDYIYLLAAGPTATVLAHDLCKRGRWAVDVGHLGMFYGRWAGAIGDETED